MFIVLPSLLISFSPPCVPYILLSHIQSKYKRGSWPGHKSGGHLNSILIIPQTLIATTFRTQSLRKLELGVTSIFDGAAERRQGESKR